MYRSDTRERFRETPKSGRRGLPRHACGDEDEHAVLELSLRRDAPHRPRGGGTPRPRTPFCALYHGCGPDGASRLRRERPRIGARVCESTERLYRVRSGYWKGKSAYLTCALKSWCSMLVFCKTLA